VLDTATQLDQVEQDILGRGALALDVDTSDRNEEVETGDDVAAVLNSRV